ncbi:MAG: carbohydrate ABC transporter permease [Solibacillus sp.]
MMKAFSQIMVRIPLILWAIIVIFPLVWMFMGAFKTNAEIFTSPWALPQNFNFSNFARAWNDFNIGRAFLNSFFVTALGSILTLALSIPTAYALERIRSKMGEVLINVYLASMMIPAVLGWIPLFFLLMKLNLLDNLWALSLIYAISHVPFTIFILIGFIGNIPKELEEAATVDGMSQYGILFKIITPLIKSGIMTVTILNAISYWNEFFMALILLQTESNTTLGVAMNLLKTKAQYESAWGVLFAGLCIAVIPVIIFYTIFQRSITKGMTEGAIK